MKALKMINSGPGPGDVFIEDRAIEVLGLTGHKNPKAAMRWLRRSGQIGFVRVSRGNYLYPVADLQRFMQERYRAPNNPNPKLA